MTVLLYAVVYAAALVFVGACVFRVLKYASAPVHLRWELYPVPHEDPTRAAHGGSYFENGEWWTHPRRTNLVGELRFMIPEILFLKGLWRFNRGLWYRSFPFHFGLYLLIVSIALLLLCATLLIFIPSLMAGSAGEALRILYRSAGTAGMALTILGALALLRLRLTDVDLKPYTTPGDVFNLAFFLISLTLLTAAFLSRSPQTPDMPAVCVGLLTFDLSLRLPALLAAGLLASALLAAYVPLTHMSHFIAKYFTYHKVLWDDAPNRGPGSLEAKMAEYLTYRPTWSASHLGADGTKTWAQVAADRPALEVKK